MDTQRPHGPLQRLWGAVLGRPAAAPPVPTAPDEPARSGDRFEPYIRARAAKTPAGEVFDVSIEGIQRQFRCKAEAVSYCSSRMVRLGLKP